MSQHIVPFLFPSMTCNAPVLLDEKQPHIIMLTPLYFTDYGVLWIICTTLRSSNMTSKFQNVTRSFILNHLVNMMNTILFEPSVNILCVIWTLACIIVVNNYAQKVL